MPNGSNPAFVSTQGERLPVRRNKDGSVIMDERGLLDLPFLVLVVLLVTIGVIMVFHRAMQEHIIKRETPPIILRL